MISALLHLLGKHEIPRGEKAPKTGSSPAEPPFLETFESSLGKTLHESQKQNLQAIPTRTTPLAPVSPPARIDRSYEVESYLKTADRLTTTPDGHALDLFE